MSIADVPFLFDKSLISSYFYSMARPKKTTDDLPDKWQDDVSAIYKKGGCDVEVRSFLGGMSDDWFYRMLDEDEEFSRIIKSGRVHAEAHWREMGRTGCRAGKINTGMYALQMRNRFNWFDANRTGENIEDMGNKLERIASAIEKSDSDTN